MRTLHGLRGTRFVTQAGLLTCERTSVFAAGASIVGWYGPQVPIWTRAGTPMPSLDVRIST